MRLRRKVREEDREREMSGLVTGITCDCGVSWRERERDEIAGLMILLGA